LRNLFTRIAETLFMDEKILNFWAQHSERFLEMALSNKKREVLLHPDGYGTLTRECGDTVEIYLGLRNGRIHHASFQTNGCLYAVACANSAVHLVSGKTLQEAWAITPQHIMDYLETLPPEEEHCAELAVRALQAALKDLHDTQKQPWKKFYPRK